MRSDPFRKSAVCRQLTVATRSFLAAPLVRVYPWHAHRLAKLSRLYGRCDLPGSSSADTVAGRLFQAVVSPIKVLNQTPMFSKLSPLMVAASVAVDGTPPTTVCPPLDATFMRPSAGSYW